MSKRISGWTCKWSERGDCQDNVRRKRKQLLANTIDHSTEVSTRIHAYQNEVIKSIWSRRVGAKHYTIDANGPFLSPRDLRARLLFANNFHLPLYTAFTDYRSQGQTIQNAIIDIASPPTGTLTPFNIYVALSRSWGREGIHLLRDFDEKLLTRHPSEFLRAEDERLARMNEETENWWKGFHVPDFA